MTASKVIDLNADVGELPELISDGTQLEVMRLVSSVNVACGAHAGDQETISATLEQAKALGLAVGAHPSYPDREGFGRRKLELHPLELSRSIRDQLKYLGELAAKAGVEINHVKPHGALYNAAADDEVIAEAIGAGISRFRRELLVIGLAGSSSLKVYRRMGLRAAGEAFIDRRYDSQGRLVSRSLPDALITDSAQALEQAKRIALAGEADTLCVHAETPGAQHLARAVRAGLEASGVSIRRLTTIHNN